MIHVRRACAALVLLLLAVSLPACAAKPTVTVMATWTGSEEAAFREVLDEFERRTGIGYDYHGTRSLSSVLAADVQKGTPPDVAILPSPNEMVDYQRLGALRPIPELEPILDRSYSPQWKHLALAGSAEPYAVVVKASLKSIVWYNKDRLPGPTPRTWQHLETMTQRAISEGQTPWCMGMGAMAPSGFPGTDWVEDILLQQAGPTVYQEWVAGAREWTSDEVERAWRTWGELVQRQGAVHGGRGAALLTDFADANDTMFAENPDCFLEHQGSFVAADYQNAGDRLGFFPTPPPKERFAEAWQVTADLAGMFRDSPEAKKLMLFLASDAAQRILPRAQQGAAFSVNKAVSRDVQQSDVGRNVARILTEATSLCYDGSDMMPAEMTSAFQRAVLDYLAEPARLDRILEELEAIRRRIPVQEWVSVVCGNENNS